MILGLLFVALVALLYVVAGVRLLSRMWRRWQREARLIRPAVRWFDRMIFAVAALGILVMLYGYLVEPRLVEINTISINTDKLPPGSQPIRIVQVSDFHSPSNLALQKRLPTLVAEQEPDVIAFTGDATNPPKGLESFRHTLKQLAQIAPTLAVRGNYDGHSMAQIDLFSGTGATELRGKATMLELQDTSVAFVGAPFWGDLNLVYTTLQSLPDGTFVVYLGHSPDRSLDIAPWGVDLYLAGHTHGGQVALPFYGAIWANSMYGKRFERGLSQVEDTWVYVNRGIGMTDWLPKARILARPEISVFEIGPAEMH